MQRWLTNKLIFNSCCAFQCWHFASMPHAADKATVATVIWDKYATAIWHGEKQQRRWQKQCCYWRSNDFYIITCHCVVQGCGCASRWSLVTLALWRSLALFLAAHAQWQWQLRVIKTHQRLLRHLLILYSLYYFVVVAFNVSFTRCRSSVVTQINR